MTVGIALRLPWENVNFGTHPQPEMVAISCDSRLTYGPTGQWWDKGEKLIQISGNAVLAYAQSTHVARRLVEEIVHFPVAQMGSSLSSTTWLNGDSAVKLVKLSLRKVHRQVLSEGMARPAARVQLLLAFIDGNPPPGDTCGNKARLFRFDTGQTGAPYDAQELRGGIYPFGDAEARAHAVSRCNEHIQSFNQGFQPWTQPWRMVPYLGIESAIACGKHKTIGGAIQSAAVYRDRLEWQAGATLAISAEGGVTRKTVHTRDREGWMQEIDGKISSKTEGISPRNLR